MNTTDTDTPDDDHAFSDRELCKLIGGATLMRYAEGTGEDEGTTMAVFRRPDGRGIGLTMNNASTLPEHLLGETLLHTDERPFRSGSRETAFGWAFILFDGHDYEDRITVRGTTNMGVYEVEDADD